jgi:hypothetical protein
MNETRTKASVHLKIINDASVSSLVLMASTSDSQWTYVSIGRPVSPLYQNRRRIPGGAIVTGQASGDAHGVQQYTAVTATGKQLTCSHFQIRAANIDSGSSNFNAPSSASSVAKEQCISMWLDHTEAVKCSHADHILILESDLFHTTDRCRIRRVTHPSRIVLVNRNALDPEAIAKRRVTFIQSNVRDLPSCLQELVPKGRFCSMALDFNGTFKTNELDIRRCLQCLASPTGCVGDGVSHTEYANRQDGDRTFRGGFDERAWVSCCAHGNGWQRSPLDTCAAARGILNRRRYIQHVILYIRWRSQ